MEMKLLQRRRKFFWRTDFPQIIENDVNGLLRRINHLHKIHVPLARIAILFKHDLHPLEEARPIGLPIEDQREARNAAGLDEGQDFEKFVQRAETTRHENEGDAVFDEANLAGEEVMEIDRDIGEPISF